MLGLVSNEIGGNFTKYILINFENVTVSKNSVNVKIAVIYLIIVLSYYLNFIVKSKLQHRIF